MKLFLFALVLFFSGNLQAKQICCENVITAEKKLMDISESSGKYNCSQTCGWSIDSTKCHIQKGSAVLTKNGADNFSEADFDNMGETAIAKYCPQRTTNYKICCKKTDGTSFQMELENNYFLKDINRAKTCQAVCSPNSQGSDIKGCVINNKEFTGATEIDWIVEDSLCLSERKSINICCIDSKTGVSRKVALWHELEQSSTFFECGNDNPGVDICKSTNERCYHNGTYYNHDEFIKMTANSVSETTCPGIDPDGDCSGTYLTDHPYETSGIYIDVKEKWKEGAAIGGVSGLLLGLIPAKKPSCYLNDRALAEWKDSFSIDYSFPPLTTMTGCYKTAFSQTITKCSGSTDGNCKVISLQNMTDSSCQGMDVKARNDALLRYNKCTAMGGKYDTTTNECEFEITLKKKKDGDVLETAFVKAGDYKCHKELFEKYYKKRVTGTVLRAGGGAVIGGATGAVIETQLTKLSRFLNKTCGIEKSKTTDLAERIKSETHKTVCELIKDIKDTGSLTHANAESCMKQINTKYPGK